MSQLVLTVLGEAVRGVSHEVQAAYPEIPSAKMRGVCNLLVHESLASTTTSYGRRRV